MIEKGKGNKINKLRKMQTIEVCPQLLMRIILGIRIEEKYENDKIRSKIIVVLKGLFYIIITIRK